MVAQIEKSSSEADKHTGSANALVYHNDRLFSGGADGRIKLWTKDLKLEKTVQAHTAEIYAMAMNPKGHLYSSSYDGYLKIFKSPLVDFNDFEVMMKTDSDEVCNLYCADDSVFYTGADEEVHHKPHGTDRVDFVYNVLMSGKYMTRAVVPGKGPIALIGPIESGRRKYLAVTTKDGQSISLLRNTKDYPVQWIKNVGSV